jgi:hypothetical protein
MSIRWLPWTRFLLVMPTFGLQRLVVAYFPFELMEIFLGSNSTARQVYQLIVSALLDAGTADTCSGLIAFLTVALVAPSMASHTPLAVHEQVGVAGYAPETDAISHCHTSVLYRYLPALSPAYLAPAASAVSNTWWWRLELNGMIATIFEQRNCNLTLYARGWVRRLWITSFSCVIKEATRSCRRCIIPGELDPEVCLSAVQCSKPSNLIVPNKGSLLSK